MIHFLGLTKSDAIFYGFLLLLAGIVFLYICIRRMFGMESDYLSDDSDSDGDWGDDD